MDIGKKDGKIMVFGGVYSNLQALQALKDIADKSGILPDNIICTGDIVAYCAQPSKCVEAIQNWGVHSICGNVELNLLNQSDDCGCNFNEGSRCDLFSKQWYPYAQSHLSNHHIDFLSTLPSHLTFDFCNKKVAVLHGEIDDVSGYVFKSTLWKEKARILEAANADVVLAGHCGMPFIDVHQDKYWINAGVIGMPANDGNTHTWYALIHCSNGELKVNFQSLEYDHYIASEKMKHIGLTPAYAKTLLTGIWDNCEILPPYEVGMQGKAINFAEEIMCP